MKPLDYSKLKETKITIPVVVLLGMLWIGFNAKDLTIGKLSEFFVTTAKAEEQYKVLTETVTENRTLIVTHINEYKLNENAKETRAITNEIYNLELYEAAQGTSQLTQQRRRDLEDQLSRLARVRACILRNASIPPGSERVPENCDAIA